MTNSPSIGKLAAALAPAQGKLKGAVKDAANPFFKSKYADLASVWDACRDALSQHGIAVVQAPRAEGATVTVTTMLVHAESGEWIAEELTVTAREDSPQAVGSAITYARRYGLASMVGVAPEDDDGNAASQGPARHVRPLQEEPPAPPPEKPVLPTPALRAWATAQKTWGKDAKKMFESAVKLAFDEPKPSKDWTEDEAALVTTTFQNKPGMKAWIVAQDMHGKEARSIFRERVVALYGESKKWSELTEKDGVALIEALSGDVPF